MKFCEWLIQFGGMCHITTWEEDYKGNNTSPSPQSPLANSSSPSCTYALYLHYKPPKHESEAREHMSFYSHCCQMVYKTLSYSKTVFRKKVFKQFVVYY
jgi:hypothetical protein